MEPTTKTTVTITIEITPENGKSGNATYKMTMPANMLKYLDGEKLGKEKLPKMLAEAMIDFMDAN